MTSTFLHRTSYERLRDRLISTAPDLKIYIFEPDATITLNGSAVADAEFTPETAWINDTVFFSPHVRDFAIRLVKSGTLKWLQSGAAGYDNPLYKTLAEKGVTLTNSNAQAPAIAEYVLATVMEQLQNSRERRNAKTERRWTRTIFREVADTTWAIIGYGNIGRETAKRAHAFGARVIGVQRSTRPCECAVQITTPDSIDALLPQADVVVLTCPLTKETRHLANAEFFQAMKPDGIFVNIGRGELVDEPALLLALENNQIGSAILDVFETEPLPDDSPFWAAPNVYVSAHCSAATDGTRRRGEDLFLENLQLYLSGQPLKNEVDPASVLDS